MAKTKTPKTKPEQVQVTYRCTKEQYIGSSILTGKTGESFSCEVCGKKYEVDLQGLNFKGDSKDHALLQLKTLGVER